MAGAKSFSQMAEPEADRDDVEEVFDGPGGPVVMAGDPTGVLQRVEATFDEVTQAMKGAIHGDISSAGITRRHRRHRVARRHNFVNFVRILATIFQKDMRRGGYVDYDQGETKVARFLPVLYVGRHGQARADDAALYLGGEV